MLSRKASRHREWEPGRIKSDVAALVVSTNRSLEDAFRLIRRIKASVANDRCVLLVCGGQIPTSLRSRPFSCVRRSEQDAALGKEKEQWCTKKEKKNFDKPLDTAPVHRIFTDVFIIF